jgi:ATP-dependent DNA helicase DinG
VRDLAESLARLNPYNDDPDMEEENTRFGLAVQAVRRAGEDLLTVSRSSKDDEQVRYAERARQRHVNVILHATPISAAEPLGEHLFGKNTVICTSATLATGGNFDLFKSRCGLDTQPQAPGELIGSQVFDFDKQALLYLPQMPTYDWQERERYFDAVADETRRLLEVSRGRTFCLSTSWAGMQYVSEKLRRELPWPVLVQGELPRTQLLSLFRNTPHAVLFGTRSFWEGVDVPGDALSQVIIDKLPFPSPRDPLHEARTEQIQENGGNSFVEYTLPLMILALKQGFGRLIRTKTDRGVVAILDDRLSTKRYGGTVLRSLPPARTSRRFGDVYRFFSTPPFEADYALTVWAGQSAVPGDDSSDDDANTHYRWRLTRLPDGRTRDGTGLGSTAYGARWAGVLAGVQNLQAAIQKGGRNSGDFRIEIRLPGTSGRPATLLKAAPAELQASLQAFADVHVLPIEDTETQWSI